MLLFPRAVMCCNETMAELCCLIIKHLDKTLFKIYSTLNGTKHLVTCSKHTLEELEFFRKELKNTQISSVFTIQKIHHHDIMLLAVSMTTANSLFDALRIPGQVVINNQGTELEVDPLGACLGGYHYPPLITKVFDQG